MDVIKYSPISDLLYQSSHHDNPLVWPLLSFLKAEPQHWKVHYLITKLQDKGLLSQLDDDDNKDLFKRNFLTMNALYQLQITLLPNEWLQVKSMDIFLSSRPPFNVELELSNDVSLREYYLDWNNYDTSGDVIQEMLKSFWYKYNSYIGDNETTLGDREQALQVFELSINATAKEIRKRWRKLALKYHPDRPDGNSQKFRQACNAWQVLRLEQDQLVD